MSKKKSKAKNNHPDSDETEAHLAKLALRDECRRQRAENVKLINVALEATGLCRDFIFRSGTWVYHEDPLANIEWQCKLDWSGFASRWVHEAMIPLIPLVEEVAAALSIPANLFFQHESPHPVPGDGIDRAAYMGNLLARLRGCADRPAEVHAVAMDLGAVLSRDPLSLRAYEVYFDSVEGNLGRVGVRIERGLSALGQKDTSTGRRPSLMKVSAEDGLESIETLYKITRYFIVTFPSIEPEILNAEDLRMRVDGAREDMPKLLAELMAASEERGISSTPLVEFGTRWVRLCRENGHDHRELARHFLTCLPEQFVVDTYSVTTARLKVKFQLELGATDAATGALLPPASPHSESGAHTALGIPPLPSDASLPADLASAVDERCSGARAVRIKAVLTSLVSGTSEWVTSMDLEEAGLPSKTVYAVSRQWSKGNQYRGESGRQREYLRKAVIRFVAQKWTPKTSG